MRTARNPFLLVDKDRYGWSDADPAMTERGRRRTIVNTFLAGRNYWRLMSWLAAKLPSHRRFLSIGEALAQARFEYAANPSEANKLVVVVAKYFEAARWHWLEAV